MSLSIKGKLVKVLAEQTGINKSGLNWVKQDFVIETQEQYPKKVCISAIGEKLVPVVKSLTLGQEIEVHINIESREYNEKWFSNINAWRIDKNTNGITNETKQDPFTPTKSNDDAGDDLPF